MPCAALQAATCGRNHQRKRGRDEADEEAEEAQEDVAEERSPAQKQPAAKKARQGNAPGDAEQQLKVGNRPAAAAGAAGKGKAAASLMSDADRRSLVRQQAADHDREAAKKHAGRGGRRRK